MNFYWARKSTWIFWIIWALSIGHQWKHKQNMSANSRKLCNESVYNVRAKLTLRWWNVQLGIDSILLCDKFNSWRPSCPRKLVAAIALMLLRDKSVSIHFPIIFCFCFYDFFMRKNEEKKWERWWIVYYLNASINSSRKE